MCLTTQSRTVWSFPVHENPLESRKGRHGIAVTCPAGIKARDAALYFELSPLASCFVRSLSGQMSVGRDCGGGQERRAQPPCEQQNARGGTLA